MKLQHNKKYFTIAVYSCAVIFFAAVMFYLTQNIGVVSEFIGNILKVFNPMIYGFVIAFLVNPVMVFCEKRIFAFVDKKQPRKVLKRVLSLVLAMIFVAALISAFVSLLVPQVVDSYTDLEKKMGGYVSSVQGLIVNVFSEGESVPKWVHEYVTSTHLVEKINDFIADSYDIVIDITPYIINFIRSIVNSLKNALIGIIFSVYFLYPKEKLCAQVKKLTYAVFSGKRASRMVHVARMTKKTFEGFVIGKIIDSIIIGVLTFIVLAIFKIPYYPIVSLIVGVTNVIPFFGPFIGAIPSAFIIFIADPVKALWFIVIIFIIQQLDGNVIGPHILGDSTNLSAIWVMVAIICMSGLLGLTGMFIGVPLFAVLYALLSEWVNKRLVARGRSRSLDAYYGDGNGIIHEEKAENQKEEQETEKEESSV